MKSTWRSTSFECVRWSSHSSSPCHLSHIQNQTETSSTCPYSTSPQNWPLMSKTKSLFRNLQRYLSSRLNNLPNKSYTWRSKASRPTARTSRSTEYSFDQHTYPQTDSDDHAPQCKHCMYDSGTP